MYRKREIPVRGRKLCKVIYSSIMFNRKREIPVRGRKHIMNKHNITSNLIEKEKSP